MKQVRISLDIGRKCIKMGRALPNNERVLFLNKDVTIDPNSERQLDLQVPWSFDAGLIEGVQSLPDKVTVIDGMCKGVSSGTKTICPVVVANFGHLPVKLSAFSPLARLTRSEELQMFLYKIV